MSGVPLMLENIWVIAATAAIVLAVTFIIWLKYTKTLWGKDFLVALPIFGEMNRWKKMTEGTGEYHPDRTHDANASYVDVRLVVPAERALYDYYCDSLGDQTVGPIGFSRAREFLKLSQQNGRRPMSLFLWLVLAALTIAEAIGTGLLVAPLMSKDITPALAMVVGTIVALAIAIIALIITHGAGEDMFRNTLLARVQASFRQNGGFRNENGSKHGDTVKAVGPGDNQADDGHLDPNARLAARINATSFSSMAPRRLRLVLSVVFIVVFGVATTAYRHFEYNSQQDQEVSGLSNGTGNYDAMFSNGNATAGNVNANALPNSLKDEVSTARSNATKDIKNDAKLANDAGIIILALIYVFTQLIGILTGYKYSFFDEGAEHAYFVTKGEISYDAFLRKVVRPVALRADMRLGQLRSHLSSLNPGYRDNMRSFSFMDAYMASVTEHVTENEAPTAVKTPVVPPSPVVSQPPVAVQAAKEPDYEAMAIELLDAGKESRSQVIADLVKRHNLTSEQQTSLLQAFNRLKSERAPAINPDLLSALAED